MIERWMLSTIVLGLILALGGICLARLCPRFGLPRRWLWLALMVLSVSLPVGMALRHNSAPAATAAPISQFSAVALTPAPAPRNIDGLLLIGWGLTSLALALFFAAIHRRMLSQLGQLTTREVLGQTVTVSPDFGPAAVGLIRSRVVLPEWVFELPVEEQQLVLRHEQQHIDAGDHFVLLAGVVMTVLMPWNIGLWWQLRRLRVGMELDCDARVAPRAADRPRYSQLLLQSRTRNRSYHAALAFVPTPSVLAERLYALLESARPSRRQMATWSVSALACAVVVTRVPVPSLAPLLRRMTPAPTAPVPIRGDSAAPRQAVNDRILISPPKRTNSAHATSAASTPQQDAPTVSAAPPAAAPTGTAPQFVAKNFGADSPLVIRVQGVDTTVYLTAEHVQSTCSAQCQQQFEQQKRADSIRLAALPPELRSAGGGGGRGGFIGGGAGAIRMTSTPTTADSGQVIFAGGGRGGRGTPTAGRAAQATRQFPDSTVGKVQSDTAATPPRAAFGRGGAAAARPRPDSLPGPRP